MHRTTLIVALVLLASVCASAQDPVTGFPPYGSFHQGGFDTINRQNLNVNLAIPTASTPARGMDFQFALVYDSLLWKKATNAWVPVANQDGTPTWGWTRQSPTGSILFKTATSNISCGVYTNYSNYVYLDPAGTRHKFSATGAENCYGDFSGTSGFATDGSGYFLDTMADGDPNSPVIYSPSGIRVRYGGAYLYDTNGNYLNIVSGNATETDWKDTVGRTALKVITSGSAIQYQFLDVNGAYQTVTMNLQSFSIKTNFACSGVVEYTGTASLPVSIVLPNGQSYALTYEDTPGFSGYKTGRLKRITLPTGGFYEYQYPTTGNEGTVCSDGTVNSLTRLVNDGTTSVTWQFARSQPDSSTWKTTVTAPTLPYDTAANQTTFTFNPSGQELTQKIYQSGETGGTLLRTINTAWATNATLASRTVILENNQQSKVETDFDTYGNLLEMREFALGSGAPGSLVWSTKLTYLSGPDYLSRNILNRLGLREVYEGSSTSGTRKAATAIGYDETSPYSCPTGASQHDEVNYGCLFTPRGNPTSFTTYTDPVTLSGGVTKTRKYDWFSNIVSGDADCCGQGTLSYSSATQYAYATSVTNGTLTTSFAYNTYTGLMASTTDPNNKTTSYTYDVQTKRPLSVQRPDGSQIQYSYNDTQRTATVQTPIQVTNVAKQTTLYDGLGRPIKVTVTDGAGASYSIVETQYDPLGRAYKISNPHNSTAQYWTETRFDALGRPTVAIPPSGTATSNSTRYSYSGLTVTVTDPAGKQRKTENDALGRLINVFEPDVNNGNALTQLTSYAYSVLDQILTITQGVQTRTFNYDGMGRLTSAITPEGGTTSYQYNTSSHVSQRTDARGVITSYSYDTMNRPTGISYNVGSTGVPATPGVTYTYGTDATQNNKGRMVTVTDGAGSETYSYDLLGRVTQVSKVMNGTTYATTYSYNLAGELTSITYPSGRVVLQNYDAIGRLCAIGTSGATCTTGTNHASGFAYNPAGEVAGFNYGNGIAAAFSYSADRLQLTSLAYTKSPTTLLSLTYDYSQGGGNNGQITSITDNTGTQEAGRSVTYAFDALGRLSTALTTGSSSYSQWGLSWTYDRYGNRTAQTVTAGAGVPSNSVTIDPATNRITGAPYSYDLNGNMTNDGANSVTYDAENRAVTAAGTTYVYDGNGLRVRKCAPNCTSPTSSTVYIFAGSKVIAEYDNSAAPASPTREYIYSGARLLAKMEAGATTYFHADHLSARVLTDANGSITGQLAHYPYGESWYGASVTKWQFTTYERDSESGNDFAMARFHVNRLGRFSALDLAPGSADPQSLNRYAYVTNDPTNRADPSGLVSRLSMSTDGNFDPISYAAGFSSGYGGGQCIADGYAIGCGFLAGFLASGAAVVCPYGCTTSTNTILGYVGAARLQYFWASTNGPGAYYSYSGPGALYYSVNQAAIQVGKTIDDISDCVPFECGAEIYKDANGVYSFTDVTIGTQTQWTVDPGRIPIDTLLVGDIHSHHFAYTFSAYDRQEILGMLPLYPAYQFAFLIAPNGEIFRWNPWDLNQPPVRIYRP